MLIVWLWPRYDYRPTDLPAERLGTPIEFRIERWVDGPIIHAGLWRIGEML